MCLLRDSTWKGKMRMADFAKLTHVASEVEGNMLVGRLKDAGLQAFVQPSVSPVQGKLYTGELGMAASGADVCVAAERLEEAKGLLNQWNAIQPDEAELAAESEETGEIPPEILEYLEEITKDKQQSRLNSMLWMGRSKMIARDFIREENLRRVEKQLQDACLIAKQSGITENELEKLLHLIYEEN